MSSSADNLQSAEVELQQVSWNLEELVGGEGADGARERLRQALSAAQSFAERYRGRVGALDAAELAAAMQALREILDLAARAGGFAALRFSTDTTDATRGALLAEMQERQTEIETTLLFFDLEWAALPEERVDALLTGAPEALAFCAHHLRSVRRYREHLLEEAEEKILAEKSLTGAAAWGRLFEELTAAIEVERDGERISLEVALSGLNDPVRKQRQITAESITAALAPGLRTRAYIFNTLLLEKSVDDRLRHYGHWLQARNLANEASDESVQALLDAVRSRYEIARRWYRLKARLLGIERLADYDRVAAIGTDEVRFPFAEGRRLVLDSYNSFSPVLGGIAERLFSGEHVDAPIRPGKRGGAFAAAVVPGVEPYVLLNYTHRRRDVLTIAHELGHAVHFSLSARQGIFHQHTPLTLAETASVFGETIVFGRLLAADSDPASRLALLAENLEDRIATVFRQVAMSRFEELVHSERRQQGEIAAERFGELWAESQRELFGDAVELSEGYRSWWSYIPHFIETPGYVYAYAYGQLLALSIYERYLRHGEQFVPSYLKMLEAGGSLAPGQLGQLVGVDLGDPGFWQRGLDLIERQLLEAEAAAEAAEAAGALPAE